MKNQTIKNVGITSIQEYREKYFPKRYSENTIIIENIEEMASSSAYNLVNKYKEALQEKKTKVIATSKRSN